MAERVACIWCGTSSEKITREHLWPEWLSEAIAAASPNQSAAPFTVRWRSGKVQQLAKMVTTVRIVCGTCNHGWMSDLENAVREPLIDMVLGSKATVTLSSRKQIQLAKWAYKTALVAEFTTLEPKIEPHWYRNFYDHKRQLPRDLIVASGAYRSSEGVVGNWTAPATITISPVSPGVGIQPRNSVDVDAHIATLLIGCAFFRIVLYDAPFPALPPVLMDRYLQRFWPPVDKPTIWPLLTSIPDDDKTFSDLTGGARRRGQ